MNTCGVKVLRDLKQRGVRPLASHTAGNVRRTRVCGALDLPICRAHPHVCRACNKTLGRPRQSFKTRNARNALRGPSGGGQSAQRRATRCAVGKNGQRVARCLRATTRNALRACQHPSSYELKMLTRDGDGSEIVRCRRSGQVWARRAPRETVTNEVKSPGGLEPIGCGGQ